MLPELKTTLTAVAALCLVLALIWLAQRLARGTALAPRRGAGRRLVVQEAVALDPRRRLHLVTCDGRAVLLLTGGTQDLVVGWPAHPAPADAPLAGSSP